MESIRRLPLVLALTLALPCTAQTLTVGGLRAPGEILTNAEGVYTVVAQNDFDAAFLEGWAQAQNRFFQMDFTRRSASGTVAALVGPAGLSSDVQLRTLGLRRAAWETYARLSTDSRGWLQAYADGVNAWLAQATLPPEYGALELTRADPWTPVDSVVIGKALAFQLSFDLDIQRTLEVAAYQSAGAAAGFNGLALYFEDVSRFAPPDDRVSVPGFTPAGGALDKAHGAKRSWESIEVPDEEVLALARDWLGKVQDVPLIRQALERSQTIVGSNAWAVSGINSATGFPLIANDPHLSLGLPSVFMEGHVYSNDARFSTPQNVTGVVVPGVPGVIQGCTDRLCWGSTVNPLDVTDTFQEQLILNSYGVPVATVYQGVREPTVQVFQSYFVNQVGDGVANNVVRNNSIGYTNGGLTILVPRRNYGPILSTSGTTGLSVGYAGWGATFELESFRQINRATNLDQFRRALQFFDVGSQNFVYADVDGDIAYFTSGEMPIREDLQDLQTVDGNPPWLIRDGTGTRRNEWLSPRNPQQFQALPFEVLPFSEMPKLVNPAAGYVANGNNDPIGVTLDNNPLNQLRPAGGLYYLDISYNAYRQGRIDRELQQMVAAGNVTVGDFMALQGNNQMLDAELVLPHLLGAFSNATGPSAWGPLADLASNARVAEAIDRLAGWDFSTPTGIRAGFDPGDNPLNLPEPSAEEVNASVAATIWAIWRAQAVRSIIDARLQALGLGAALPGARQAYDGLKNLLDQFDERGGVGVSGVMFFQAIGAPNAAAARDFMLLKALADGLDRLASDEFAPAFAGSQNLSDYRWGQLHRITFAHPLGSPLSIPGDSSALYGFSNLGPGLPGISRAGGYDVVDASGHSARSNTLNSFTFAAGASRRMVAEMNADGVRMFQIIPGGQSGVFGSPFYVNQLGRWLTNGYKQVPISIESATAASVQEIRFVPR